MSRGEHAADDSSFTQSTSASAGRGVLLIALAFVIGVILLQATDEEPPGTGVIAGAESGTTTTTTEPASGPTTTTLPLRQPADIKVIVANGSSVKGAAAGATEALRPDGYNVLAPTNAVRTAATSVYFIEGLDREAAQLASALDLAAEAPKPMPDPRPIPDSKDAEIIVVLGADSADRFGEGSMTSATEAN